MFLNVGERAHRFLRPVGVGKVDRVGAVARGFNHDIRVARGCAAVHRSCVVVIHVVNGVAEIGTVEGLLHAEVAVVAHLHTACRTALGGDDDYTVTGLGSVHRGRRSVFEHRDRLHGRGVEFVHVRLEAVDQDERIGTQQRRDTANLDFCTVAARHAGALRHENTSCTTLKGLRQAGDGFIGEIGVFDDADRRGDFDLRLRGHSRHDHLFERRSVFGQSDRHVRYRCVDANLLGLVTQVADDQHVAFLCFEGEEAAAVGGRTRGGSLYDDGGADKRCGRLFGIDYNAPDGKQITPPLSFFARFGYPGGFIVDGYLAFSDEVSEIGSRKEAFQRLGEFRLFDFERYALVEFGIRGVGDEEDIAALLFDGFKKLPERGVVGREADFSRRGGRCAGVGKDCVGRHGHCRK